MVWFDLSWVPAFFQHETLDVRIPGPVEITPEGYRYPGDEVPVARFVGAFYPESGDDAEKDDDGQHRTGTASLYTATDLPVADDQVEPSQPGARLYHLGRLYEFVHKEAWTSGGYFRYTLRLRGHVIPIDPPNGGGGGGGGG